MPLLLLQQVHALHSMWCFKAVPPKHQ